jgi:hypothetical protein
VPTTQRSIELQTRSVAAMKFSLLPFLLFIGAGIVASSSPAKACDFDLVNSTDSPIGDLRLYNSANRYVGLGDQGPLLKGDKFRFARRRIRSGGAAWPDTCGDSVYIDLIVGKPGEATISLFGGSRCHVKAQIRQPSNATFEANNQHVVVITSKDLTHAGVCRDR